MLSAVEFAGGVEVGHGQILSINTGSIINYLLSSTTPAQPSKALMLYAVALLVGYSVFLLFILIDLWGRP